MIAGRVLQGAGAISGVAIAMAADLTREDQRTKAMAIIGSTIGVAFALSFVVAPFLEHAIGVPGIFALTGVLALAAIAVVRFVVPAGPATHARAPARAASRGCSASASWCASTSASSCCTRSSWRSFVVVPVALVRAGLPAQDHWWIYLGTVVARFRAHAARSSSGLAPPTIAPVFLGAIAAIGAVAARCSRPSSPASPMLVAALVIFFAGFNVLEAKLPALVSRAAPPGARGAATGVYSSVQFLGMFVGGALRGHRRAALRFRRGAACACLAVDRRMARRRPGTWANSCRPQRRHPRT